MRLNGLNSCPIPDEGSDFGQKASSAFNPANIVPGMGFSPDKMLQGRLFSYGDAQRYRLGVNHNLIPVNAPRCPFHSYHRDSHMRVDGYRGATFQTDPTGDQRVSYLLTRLPILESRYQMPPPWSPTARRWSTIWPTFDSSSTCSVTYR